jgi:hypothetical protein
MKTLTLSEAKAKLARLIEHVERLEIRAGLSALRAHKARVYSLEELLR